jgi:hypothetical protein
LKFFIFGIISSGHFARIDFIKMVLSFLDSIDIFKALDL